MLFILLCLATSNCLAIDYYVAGDSLWVWAKSGLNIREMPNDSAKVLGVDKNRGQVVALEDQARNWPYEIVEIKASVEARYNKEINQPSF